MTFAIAVYALLIVLWALPWSSTSTADADQASAVESNAISEEEALWTRA
jgi:hypothetical protein